MIKVVVILLLAVILVTTAGIAISLFLPERRRREPGGGAQKGDGFFKDPKFKWVRNLVSVIALYAVIYLIPETKWWIRSVWIDHPWWLVLLAHLLIVWGYLILPDNPKNPSDRKLARWVIRFGTVLLLITFGLPWFTQPLRDGKVLKITRKGYWFSYEWTFQVANTFSKTSLAKRLPEGGSMNSPEAQKLYDIIMSTELARLSPTTAQELFITCGLESGYRQFEKDGKTPLIGKYKNGTPNGAIGVCQVKPEFWGEIAEKRTQDTGVDHSLETLEGQGRMSVWIAMNEPDWRSKWELNPSARQILSEMPKGESPNAALTGTPTGAAAVSARNTSDTPKPAPAMSCKEVRIETSLDQPSEPIKLGKHAYVRTQPPDAYWILLVQVEKILIQNGNPKWKVDFYPLGEFEDDWVSFQTYKLAPPLEGETEGKTVTIFLTPCSNGN